jgi:hypothetical protein
MKNHEVRVKLSKEEHDKIKLKAKKLYMTMAQFMRTIALTASVEISNNYVSSPDFEITLQIMKII